MIAVADFGVKGIERAPLRADVGGRLAASTDGAQTFTRMTLKNPMPLTAIAALGEGRLALTGPRGVAVSEALIAR